jgi:hypothetical protein
MNYKIPKKEIVLVLMMGVVAVISFVGVMIGVSELCAFFLIACEVVLIIISCIVVLIEDM